MNARTAEKTGDRSPPTSPTYRRKPGVTLQLLLAIALWTAAAHSADPLVRREWTVDGVLRQTLIYVPPSATTRPAPVVFAFHGHGGSMQNAARSFGYHSLWPEAIVVYPQGLDTPGRLTDPEGRRPGWQAAVGDQGDRDLKFFDAVLASLKTDYHLDEKRIYATGHSNGGGFTYLLWAQRGDVFAAVAPSSAVDARSVSKLRPKPVLHVAGQDDSLVKFAWQQRMIEALRKLNQCGEGQSWEGEKDCTIYPSDVGAPVVTLIHSGGHQFPAVTPSLIVKFFKQHPKP